MARRTWYLLICCMAVPQSTVELTSQSHPLFAQWLNVPTGAYVWSWYSVSHLTNLVSPLLSRPFCEPIHACMSRRAPMPCLAQRLSTRSSSSRAPSLQRTPSSTSSYTSYGVNIQSPIGIRTCVDPVAAISLMCSSVTQSVQCFRSWRFASFGPSALQNECWSIAVFSLIFSMSGPYLTSAPRNW